MKQVKEVDKKDSSVEANPKPIASLRKSKLIKFHLEKARIVNIDKNLKRIYSITN